MSEDRLKRIEDDLRALGGKVTKLDTLMRGGNGTGVGVTGEIALFRGELKHTNERLDTIARRMWQLLAAVLISVGALVLERVLG